jgi:hypothetical protein
VRLEAYDERAHTAVLAVSGVLLVREVRVLGGDDVEAAVGVKMDLVVLRSGSDTGVVKDCCFVYLRNVSGML